MNRPLFACMLVAALIATPARAGEADDARARGLNRYCVTAIEGPLSITGMNERGHVVGTGLAGEVLEVFLWDRRRGSAVIEGLTEQLEFPGNQLFDLNDRDQIVGTRRSGPDGAQLRASVWNRRGRPLRLLEPAPADDHSIGIAINNRGQVTGTSGPFPDESTTGVRSVIWDRHGGVTVIPEFPDSLNSRPYDINEAGQVIGANDTPDGTRGFLWDPVRGLRAIDSLPGAAYPTVPHAINDRGELVATSSFEGVQRAAMWSERTGIVDLGNLPGGTGASLAYDINNHREIVGYGETGTGGHAVFWDPDGQIHDLNDLILRDEPDDQFLHLVYGWKITDAGWITAVGVDTRDTISRYFLLTPARRPHTCAGPRQVAP